MTCASEALRRRVHRSISPRLALALLLGLVGALVPLAGVGAGLAGPTEQGVVRQEGDGLEVDATSTYELVPDEDRVHVTVELRLRTLDPPRRRGDFIEHSFLEAFSLPMLRGATAVEARTAGRSLPVDIVDQDQFVSFAAVDLVPDLEYGSPQAIVVEYDLPAQAPRTESFIRINDAFVSFGMFAIGDGGSADVVVVLPDDLDVEFVGGDPSEEDDGERTRYRFDDIADPAAFFTTVAARDDDALVDRSVQVAGIDVLIRAWPGDVEWADFVSKTLEDGIPALEELIGEEWPADDELEVVESASPYLYGYSGWFLPAEGLIEMGDELDEQVVLHEIAHLWFNDDLFRGRWISEGFAEVYASRAREAGGDDVPEPVEPGPGGPGAQPLEQWAEPDLLDPATDESERYGYATSFLVMDRLFDDVGEAEMRSVLAAARDREISYVGDGDAEALASAPDWRRLLDLVVERAGSEVAEELFSLYVVGDDGRVALERRALARARYDEVEDAGDGWSPPHPLRLAMTEWDFDHAEELADRTEVLLDRRDEVLDQTEPVGVTEVAGMEAAYETATTMEELAQVVALHETVASILVEADRIQDRTGGALAFVASIGDPGSDRLDRAVDAFEDGDLTASRRYAEDAIGFAGDSTVVGGLRLLALALIIVLGAALLRLRGQRRRRRRAHRAQGADHFTR